MLSAPFSLQTKRGWVRGTTRQSDKERKQETWEGNQYLPCVMRSSIASSTRARRESSLANSSSSWAGESSSNMPVILLANACKGRTLVLTWQKKKPTSKTIWKFYIILHYLESFYTLICSQWAAFNWNETFAVPHTDQTQALSRSGVITTRNCQLPSQWDWLYYHVTVQFFKIVHDSAEWIHTGCMAWTRGYRRSPKACLWAGSGSGSSLGFPSDAGRNGLVSMDSCLRESL